MSGYNSIASYGTITITQPLSLGTNIDFLNNAGDAGVVIFSRGALGVSTITSSYSSILVYGTNITGPLLTATVSGTLAASAYFGGSITNFLPAAYGLGGDKVTIQVIESLFNAMDVSSTAAADNALFAGQVTLAAGAYTGLSIIDGTLRPGPGSVFAPDANEARIIDNIALDLFGSAANSAALEIQFTTRTNPGANHPFIDAVISTKTPINPGNPVNPCFAAGTRILTTRGEVKVEELILGDLVITQDGLEQPIIWIGRRGLTLGQFHRPELVRPIIIESGALADGVPATRLVLSPDHALYLDGLLVPAKELINWSSIYQDHAASHVTYYHIELPRHGIVFAQGAAVESFLDTGHRGVFDNADETLIALPSAMQAQREVLSCAPLCGPGPALEAIRQRLAARQVGIALPMR